MKEVILSADGEAKLYQVPDAVADDLERYCEEFAAEWLWNSPHAAKYRKKSGTLTIVSYTEQDFIEYLNTWIFPEEPSVLARGLGFSCGAVPEAYQSLPQFNF